jgi:hypothetical protein
MAVFALDGLCVDYLGTVWAFTQYGSAASARFSSLATNRATPAASLDGQQYPDDEPQAASDESKKKVKNMVGVGPGYGGHRSAVSAVSGAFILCHGSLSFFLLYCPIYTGLNFLALL